MKKIDTTSGTCSPLKAAVKSFMATKKENRESKKHRKVLIYDDRVMVPELPEKEATEANEKSE